MKNVVKIEMDLKSDLFAVSREGQSPTVSEMIEAVKKAGFGAVEASKERALSTAISKPKRVLPKGIKEALVRARRENKLVLIDFTASWCGPCQRMSRETFADPRVKRELTAFIFVKIDTDDEPAATKSFDVAGIPDLRILSATGTELRKLVGFKDAKTMLDILQQVTRR